MMKANSSFNGEMFTSGDRVLVGLSGGADSVALLLLLCELREEKNIEVFACHVNHGIRGEEALRDEKFCISLCEKYGVELFVRHIDVPKIAKEKHISEEMCGRDERYRVFGELSEKLGAKIAVAHNKNDVAETVLFNLFRGCSLDGAVSLRPVRDNIYRPLLGVTRREIEEYVTEYMTDSTNGDLKYARNRIRNVLLPEAQKINERATENIAEFSFSLEADKEYLDAEAKKEYVRLVTDRGLSEDVLQIHDAIKNRVVKMFLSGNGVTVSKENIEKLLRIFKSRKKDEFTGDKYFVYENGFVKREIVKKVGKFDEIPLHIGENYTENVKITLISVDLEEKKQYNKKVNSHILLMDADKINGDLSVRSKIDGEGFRPQGRRVYKTLKKFFSECHIPSDERNGVPIIADKTGIVAVAPFSVDERAAVGTDTKKVLVLITETEDK